MVNNMVTRQLTAFDTTRLSEGDVVTTKNNEGDVYFALIVCIQNFYVKVVYVNDAGCSEEKLITIEEYLRDNKLLVPVKVAQ